MQKPHMPQRMQKLRRQSAERNSVKHKHKQQPQRQTQPPQQRQVWSEQCTMHSPDHHPHHQHHQPQRHQPQHHQPQHHQPQHHQLRFQTFRKCLPFQSTPLHLAHPAVHHQSTCSSKQQQSTPLHLVQSTCSSKQQQPCPAAARRSCSGFKQQQQQQQQAATMSCRAPRSSSHSRAPRSSRPRSGRQWHRGISATREGPGAPPTVTPISMKRTLSGDR